MDLGMVRERHGRGGSVTRSQLAPWLSAVGNDPRRPVAVILGGGINALSFVRSLGRHGVPTAMLAGSPTGTRYGKTHLLPDAVTHPNAWLEMLEWIASSVAVQPVLLPTSDPLVRIIANNTQTLTPLLRFLLPDADTVETILNKRTQYEHARSAGIPIPISYFPDSLDELRRLSAHIEFPCLLKPYYGHLTRPFLGAKALIARYRQELIAGFEQCVARGHAVMVQDVIPGDDTMLFGYVGFWDADGQERSWHTKQKLRQYPSGLGTASFQRSIDAPQVAQQSRRLLTAFGYRGLVGVEFKYDKRDGSYRLIEINPRAENDTQLAIDAGIDLPWIAYRHLSGQPSQSTNAPSAFQPGVHWIDEQLDIRAFLQLRRAHELTFPRWLLSLYDTRSHAWWSARDPLPLIWRATASLRRDQSAV
jgi:predicted ATP-grasp superfamily ATP-dependent carboligase